MKTAQIKFRRIFQTVIPLRARDFFRRFGKLTQQAALRRVLSPHVTPTFDEANDFHFVRDILK
jgi:hypothetical protein